MQRKKVGKGVIVFFLFSVFRGIVDGGGAEGWGEDEEWPIGVVAGSWVLRTVAAAVVGYWFAEDGP